jgi:uncharacterized protein YbbC (DUF1343 family)
MIRGGQLGVSVSLALILSLMAWLTVNLGLAQPMGMAGSGPKEGGRGVLTGIDVLEQRHFDLLQRADGRKSRIGLVTNQTGVDRSGRRTTDVLAHAPGVELSAIFSPEHGIAGSVDTTAISDSLDRETGVPIYSVYGASDAQRRPPASLLRKLDAMVFDLQDAGARFYTYETTLGYFLEAAAEAGIPLFVLDRPNPIAGLRVQGPISDPQVCRNANCRFVNYYPLPVRHGMTMGEVARLFNGELHLGAQLTVIPMKGWQRGDWFDATGLPWVDPSPNLRSLTAATLYPGVALIEGTNVSVGRGTGTPFEMVGAPWIKAEELAAFLNRRALTGVKFVPAAFTPNASRYAQERCNGVRIVVLNRDRLDPAELGIELASALHRLYASEFKLEQMQDLLANPEVFGALLAGQDPRRIESAYRVVTARFETLRKKYLLY